MAIEEDVIDLWTEFPLQLKIEPLDDLFDLEPKFKLAEMLYESPTSTTDCDASDSEGGRVESLPVSKAPKPEPIENTLEVTSGVFGETLSTSKLYDCDDFHSFLAREGGIDQERLARLVDNVIPKADEDFASFLARSNGIKDEQMITRLRQALHLEPIMEYRPATSNKAEARVKMEVDLKVGDEEDAASFFVRTGSWESASSISEELASVGLDEFVDEDAESFFKRTESFSETDYEGDYVDGVDCDSPDSVTIASTQEEVDALKEKVLVQLSPRRGSTPSNPKDHVLSKKRKSSDEE